MNWRTLTKFIIIATIVILITYDVFALIFGHGATLSQIFLDWSLHWLEVSFFWGVLAGHLLFPQKVAERK